MKREIVEFKVEHLETLDIRDADLISLNGFEMDELIDVYLASGPFKSILVDGKCIAIIGLYTYWPGVAECYMITGKGVEENKVYFARAVKDLMTEYIIKDHLHRIQCTVHEENTRSYKWLTKFMGFESEGLMRGYGPDKANYFRLARYWE